MRALITGATGAIGRRLAARLLAEGDQVVAVGRDVGTLAARVPGARAVSWDGATLPPDALAGVDVVFHLAGEPVAGGRWTEARKARIRDSRVASTRALVASLRAAPREGRVLVCASAVGLYGSRGDEVLTEASAPGSDFLAEVCRAWESTAREAEAFGVRVANVRIGVVLMKDGGALAKMLPLFSAGLGGKLGDGRQWMPWIHVDDVVGLLLHAAREPRVVGPIHAVSPAPVDNAAFTRALGAALHRPAWLPAPSFAIRLAFGDMADVVLGSQRALPEVARRTGYVFRHPTLEGALVDLLGAASVATTHGEARS